MTDHRLESIEGPRYCDQGAHRGDWVVYVRGPIYITPTEYAAYTTASSLNITVGAPNSIRSKICVTCHQPLIFDAAGEGVWHHKDQRFDTHKAAPAKEI